MGTDLKIDNVSSKVKDAIANGIINKYLRSTTKGNQAILIFNTKEYQKATGEKEPTLKEIRTIFGLPKGSLKSFNGYRTVSGTNLDSCRPSEVSTALFFNGNVNIPIDSLDRYQR